MNPSIYAPSTAERIASPIVAFPEQPARPTGAHPAAELFPMMKDTDLGLLVEDIDEHGLREPILVYQGLVLDGRNRLRACEIAGVEPRFIEWDGVGSPLAIVLSRNLHRRHLNEGQRAIIAARAKRMFEDEAGEVAVSDAAALTPRSKDQQRESLTAVREGRARTLRQAAEAQLGPQPAALQSGESSSPKPRQCRAEAKRFVHQLGKLLLRLAAFGPSDHTQQMRDCVQRLIDLFQDFAGHFIAGKE